MNKKFVILASVLASVFVFVLALVFALTFASKETEEVSPQKVFHYTKPTIVRDYNKNVLKTFPAPYAEVNGLFRL